VSVRYAPYADARQRRKPGLAPLDPAAWIETDAHFADQMAYRERLIADRRSVVFAETETSRPAQTELLETLCANLAARDDYQVFETAVQRPDGTVIALSPAQTGPDTDPPVLTAGRLTQEDFCVLERGAGDSEYVLTSAILCFPSRWSLAEKIGHPLTAIHGPVPDYTEDLAKRVNRVFEGVKVGLPLWRANWTVHDHAELHQPSGDWRNEAGGETLYIRVERQTFVRLPHTQAVVFGIRTFIDPLDSLSDEQAAALFELVEAQDADDIDYRGGDALHAKICTYLTERLR
jgi:hypothetical protein